MLRHLEPAGSHPAGPKSDKERTRGIIRSIIRDRRQIVPIHFDAGEAPKVESIEPNSLRVISSPWTTRHWNCLSPTFITSKKRGRYYWCFYYLCVCSCVPRAVVRWESIPVDGFRGILFLDETRFATVAMLCFLRFILVWTVHGIGSAPITVYHVWYVILPLWLYSCHTCVIMVPVGPGDIIGHTVSIES